MQLPQDAMLLRIFFGEQDRFAGRPLYDAIVQKARELAARRAPPSCAGRWATAATPSIHRANLFEISEDLPIVVEIVESEAEHRASACPSSRR